MALVNYYEMDGDIARIRLDKRDGPLFCVVDAVDLDLVASSMFQKWQARWSSSARTHYVQTRMRPNGPYVQLHRLLMGVHQEDHQKIVVDHRDFNGLNNRRSNLRVVTRAINQMHRAGPQRNTTSGFRGVSWDRARNRWMAGFSFTEDGQRRFKFCGYFDAPVLAAQAAQKGREEYMLTRKCVVDPKVREWL